MYLHIQTKLDPRSQFFVSRWSDNQSIILEESRHIHLYFMVRCRFGRCHDAWQPRRVHENWELATWGWAVIYCLAALQTGVRPEMKCCIEIDEAPHYFRLDFAFTCGAVQAQVVVSLDQPTLLHACMLIKCTHTTTLAKALYLLSHVSCLQCAWHGGRGKEIFCCAWQDVWIGGDQGFGHA